MQPVFYFGIAAVSLSSVASLSLILMWKQIQSQNRTIQTLTNLVASKDLSTFQHLQATTSHPQNQNEHVEQVHPLNDAVMAGLLADQFEKQGLDPKLAYAQDDESFIEEFGLH